MQYARPCQYNKKIIRNIVNCGMRYSARQISQKHEKDIYNFL
jgi:hypothetical protein